MWGIMTVESFSARLRAEIAARYGPQREGWFADHIGMSRTHLSRVLNNPNYRPELETVRRYADGLGLEAADVARWIPGYIAPAGEAGEPVTTPVPAIYTDAFSEMAHMTDAEIIAYVEAKPGRYHRERMARQKARRTPASYAQFCRDIFRAWTANEDLALKASEDNHHRE